MLESQLGTDTFDKRLSIFQPRARAQKQLIRRRAVSQTRGTLTSWSYQQTFTITRAEHEQ